MIAPAVAMRDCLSLSFALDYEREGGDPSAEQTPVGSLRSEAKPYDKQATLATFAAADRLVELCVEFVTNSAVYRMAEGVLAVPPRPGKKYDLPTYIAMKMAVALAMTDMTAAFKGVRTRPELKNLTVAEKLEALDGTMEVDSAAVAGKTLLLVDDLYQSGVTLNYCAMLLLEAGAARVLGLTCEKTCRNDDNTGAR